MFWRKPNPWDGRYAIPDYVLSEPPRFGTHTTDYTPRRTIGPMPDDMPPAWKSGDALPEYVEQEPLGRGVFRTKYLPRKTVGTLVPDYLGADEPEADGVAKTTDELAANLATCFGMSSRDLLVAGAVAGTVGLLAVHGLRHLLGGR